jgi:hypothetical protein
MPRIRQFARTLVAAFAVVIFARTCSSQPAPQPVAPRTIDGVRWSGAVGIETLSLRDIARTTRPVTASPVAWQGSGPVFRGRLSWENPRRLHQIDFGGSLSGGFEYVDPLRSRETPEGDRARYFDARYEYRRYTFRDLLLRGLDVGFGVEALAARTSFSRRIVPSTDIREARTNAGIGGSVVARVNRWNTVGAEIVWANGLVIGRRHEEWSNGATASGLGGGWLTTLGAQADVRVSGSAKLVVLYAGSGEGFLSSHRSYALGRRRVAVGVIYEH